MIGTCGQKPWRLRTHGSPPQPTLSPKDELVGGALPCHLPAFCLTRSRECLRLQDRQGDLPQAPSTHDPGAWDTFHALR